MAEQPIKAHLSQQKTFYVLCPHCNQSKTLPLKDLPQNFTNPFQYECPCGVPSMVLLNFRKTHRRGSKLTGAFTVVDEAKSIERYCTVLDLSETGMQISTDAFKTIAQGQLFDVRVILDDTVRSRFEARCVVQRIVRDRTLLLLGLAFENLRPHQQECLGTYFMIKS